MSEKRRLGLLLGDRSNSFWDRIKRSFNTASTRFGFEIEYFQAETDGNPDEQASELERMLKMGFTAVIVNPIQNRCLASGITKAAGINLPVFDVGAKTDRKLVKDLPNYHPTPTVDFYFQGELGGRFIVERLRERDEWQVAIIEGRPESTQSIKRCSGAADILISSGANRLIAREPAHFKRVLAAELTEKLLRSHDLSAIFCANDLMALGAADAAEAMNRTGLIIVGVDFIPEAAREIETGRLTASVAFSPSDVAEAVLAAVDRRLSGRPPIEGYPVSSRVVHYGNIKDEEDALK